MFKEIGIKNGVLMLSAFFENGEFYVYDTGFRLQGEAPHLILKHLFGYDQREMLIRFALTGSEGDIDILNTDDAYFKGKWAATLWFLLKQGTIEKIEGLDNLKNDPNFIDIVQRFNVGDKVQPDWIGTEKQVFARLYFCAGTKKELAETLDFYMRNVHVRNKKGEDLLLKGFNTTQALDLTNLKE